MLCRQKCTLTLALARHVLRCNVIHMIMEQRIRQGIRDLCTFLRREDDFALQGLLKTVTQMKHDDDATEDQITECIVNASWKNPAEFLCRKRISKKLLFQYIQVWSPAELEPAISKEKLVSKILSLWNTGGIESMNPANAGAATPHWEAAEHGNGSDRSGDDAPPAAADAPGATGTVAVSPDTPHHPLTLRVWDSLVDIAVRDWTIEECVQGVLARIQIAIPQGQCCQQVEGIPNVCAAVRHLYHSILMQPTDQGCVSGPAHSFRLTVQQNVGCDRLAVVPLVSVRIGAS
eukprot:m.389150 g.389150  ORF g.389150 m.389150 type:complete len:290 (+) comp21048_c0_seq1:40-909(+)